MSFCSTNHLFSQPSALILLLPLLRLRAARSVTRHFLFDAVIIVRFCGFDVFSMSFLLKRVLCQAVSCLKTFNSACERVYVSGKDFLAPFPSLFHFLQHVKLST